LIRQLLEVPKICWINIYALESDNTLRQLREAGFAEWTRSNGSRLNIAAFPTMRAVVQDRTARMTSTEDNQDIAESDWLAQRGGRAALMVPLMVHGRATGIVILVDTATRIFDPQEINLAQGIANVMSNALENAQLYRSLESRAKALESAYNELKDADRAKDTFIQTLSHELRTPLIHVLGYADLLTDEAFGPLNDEQRDALRSIAEKAQQVADIVGDMVSVQAQETQPLEFQLISLGDVINQVLIDSAEDIKRSRLRVITHFSEAAAPVMGNPRMIAQAFEKLLDNALKFGRDGQKIEVAIRNLEGPFVQVAVRDYGIGIDASEHEKVFQRFYQVDSTATRHYSGAGLGLSVVRAIVESHGGRVGVKSRLNEGSIFFFTLPRAEIFNK
jgi:signal transduction histidine kinase